MRLVRLNALEEKKIFKGIFRSINGKLRKFKKQTGV